MAVTLENGQDPTMGINNFGEMKVLSVSETICRNLLLILFGKPGFYPSNPTLGLDISNRLYEFDSVDVDDIKVQLQNQCSELIPEIEARNFDVITTTYKGQNMLVIRFPIITDGNTLAMALGITSNGKGEFMYHFVEDKENLI